MTYFIYTFTGALCNYFSCIHLLPNKQSAFKKLCIFLYAFSTLFIFNRIYGQASTFLTLIGILLLTFLFTNNKYLNLSCYLFGYIYTIAFNYLFMWLADFLLQMDMTDLLASNTLTILFSCTYCIYCGISTKILGWYFHKKIKLSQYLTNFHLLRAIFIDLLVLVFFYIFNFSYGEYIGYSYAVIALNGITFLILFTITVTLMYSIYKITLAEQQSKNRMAQFENLRSYTNRLEESYGIMRKFKHDYINILSTMSGFINEENITDLKDYYEEKILPISHAFTESDTKLGSLSNIKNTALKSLLSSKFIYALETGIQLDIELTEPIDHLFMDIINFSRIIGIFLDNAIEASKETEEKKTCFCMFYKGQNLYVIIQNTAKPPGIPLSKLRSQGVSSKGEHRGTGLYNVSMILKDHDNVTWDTKYEKPYFIQELILVNRSL